MTTQNFEPMMPLPPGWGTMRAGDPRWRDWAEDGRRKSAVWMRTLEQGRVVHYHHGLGIWVRCEVVMHPLRVPASVEHDPSVPSLVPLHVVGPRWLRELTWAREWWLRKIRAGESFQPSATNIYESPYWTAAGEDPATMEILDL